MIPLSWNPVPLAAALDNVTLVPPVFVTVTLCDCLLPTVTVPNAVLAGFRRSCPSLMPSPVSEILVAAVDALLVIAAVAEKAPAALG